MKALSKLASLIALSALCIFQQAHAAISLDRTRLIFPGTANSVALNISNANPKLPYLAQGWVETTDGKKITSPFMVIPPIQRVEAGTKSQVVVQATSAVSTLPQDRESLYYFNLREIPPKSEKADTLQIALQTKIKFFYRPKSLVDWGTTPFEEKIELLKVNGHYEIKNPTGYYITVAGMQSSETTHLPKDFSPFMVAPKSDVEVPSSIDINGNAPVITYVNDFGGRPQLVFNCSGSVCHVVKNIKG